LIGDCVHIYYLIDASSNEGVEEEGYFEEEEYFDQFANQGKLSCDTLMTHVLPCIFCKLTKLLREIIGLDELVSVDDIKSIKLSLDSLVLDNIIMIPSYA
jgi:hypothetical protein